MTYACLYMRIGQAIFVAGHLLATAALPAPAEESIPRAEHPRPDRRRDVWQNLNGSWQFCFDPDDRGLGEQWPLGGGPFDRTVTVPFPWQSNLSGIADASGQQVGWYRRTIAAPAQWSGGRVWLCFGAVQREARVWVNGRAVGRSEQGYTPFAFDITEFAPPGSEARLDVRVADPPDPGLPGSAQDSDEFPRSSGIWQTVWMESRPVVYVDGLRLTAARPGGRWVLEVDVELAGPDGLARVAVHSPDPTVQSQRTSVRLQQGRGASRSVLEIRDPKTWSPEEPDLYDLEVSVTGANGQRDVVQTYFGLRTIARGRYGGIGNETFLLNGEPLYVRGAIDASLNAEGLATAPDDAFLRRDLELARKLGLNLLKIPGKADDPRRLYWADKLGVLLWQEMPGTALNTERSRAAWQETMRAVVRRDRNHPSLIGWTLFRQSQGLGGEQFTGDRATQQWVYERVREVREQLDPFRLVEDNATSLSGHVDTDVNTWQFRIDDYWIAREHIAQIVSRTQPGSPLGYVPGLAQGTAPLVCGQFVAVPPEGGDVSWALRFLITQLRRHSMIQGHIVSSLYDLPWRRDGLLHYDRSAKEFGYDMFLPGMTLADLQGDDFIGLDSPPTIQAAPGEEIAPAIFVSHWSDRQATARLRWQVVGIDDFGRPVATRPQERDVSWQRGVVTYQTPLRVQVPEGAPFVGALAVELLDADDHRIAANYVNLIVGLADGLDSGSVSNLAGQARPHVEVLAPRLVAVRIPPADFASFHADVMDTGESGAGKGFFAFGNCEVQYRVALPAFVRDAVPTQMVLMAELAGLSGIGRVPVQSASAKQPGSVGVYIGETELWQIPLPDDPADSRGVLSHHARFHHGNYGDLIRKRVDLTRLPRLREDMCQEESFSLVFRIEGPQTGLAIYGRQLGQTMVDPTLVIQTAKQLDRPVGFVSFDPVTRHK